MGNFRNKTEIKNREQGRHVLRREPQGMTTGCLLFFCVVFKKGFPFYADDVNIGVLNSVSFLCCLLSYLLPWDFLLFGVLIFLFVIVPAFLFLPDTLSFVYFILFNFFDKHSIYYGIMFYILYDKIYVSTTIVIKY